MLTSPLVDAAAKSRFPNMSPKPISASHGSNRRGTWAYYRLVPEAIEALRGALGA